MIAPGLLNRARWAVLAIVLGVVTLVGSFALHRAATAIYFDQTAERAENTLGLAVSMLRGQLDRFRQLPELMAQQQNIQLFAGNPAGPGRLDAMNAYLADGARLLGASDIYIIAPDGTTLAASNYGRPDSFVGENFGYRPYFQDAVRQGRGSFFGVGTTSGLRGYYFAAPIINDTGVAGVIALKVDLDRIEATWLAEDYEILVTDPEGIVFMSARPEWLFSALRPLHDDRLARTNETRRYADAELVELPLSLSQTRAGQQLTSVRRDSGLHEYLTVSEPMWDAGWTVKVYADTSAARRQAAVTVAVIWLAVGFAVTALLLWSQRRARLSERLRHQHEIREELQQRVAARTADLAQLNDRLASEVAERRHTEGQLRRTQNELVQAAKLAALGQMSAELSHEFNQPLAALRSYLDSAQVLIDRGRVPDAARYLTRITGLANRMSSISQNLSSFARRPGEKLDAISPQAVIDDALEILAWRIRAEDIRVTTILPDAPVCVLGGHVRLQQVIVNLLSNAMDAMSEQDRRLITLTVSVEGQRVCIAIQDNGPGVPDAIIARIFDPFFSTKGIGRGLGLGLSISFNIVKDFGGELTVSNTPGQGALFRVWLTPATKEAPEPA
ncbi:MAG: two-component sensor histidine kinase [Paracoccus denitrificans]|nr:MAG: two-component sensor histidine kinase [Paracoccus denitrificans]PZO85535.1 MAG: two-component sensor histidine kinase [Paracoccus denitrificans]